jgi:hypothetical protein
LRSAVRDAWFELNPATALCRVPRWTLARNPPRSVPAGQQSILPQRRARATLRIHHPGAAETQLGRGIAIVQLDLPPRESKNIMTTWALDRKSIGVLRDSFKARWEEEYPEIVRKWQLLKDGSDGASVPLLDRKRIPVD